MAAPDTVTITYITTYAGLQPVAWAVTFEYDGSETATLHSFDEAENIQSLLEQMNVPLNVSIVEEDVEDAR